MFSSNRATSASGSSSHPDSCSGKKQRRDAGNLQGDFDKEYKCMSRRNVLPMKCSDPDFLARQGLQDDFDLLVGNTGMTVFAALNSDTYKRATLEFLSTFHDDLALLGQNTTMSF
ncbi:hypothetical protein QYE76_032797 [Lolium multiflorum]|uniref:Arabidopsis retrotransposon Orf1 C-terminal domain-containing protein n=1 Tax=Lolium multiflorum TaxID=4521 RepID=A0AAD8VJP7_LOLMU|nr:hypothetical protein QYE76_032797 [Lolium multiflorum]